MIMMSYSEQRNSLISRSTAKKAPRRPSMPLRSLGVEAPAWRRWLSEISGRGASRHPRRGTPHLLPLPFLPFPPPSCGVCCVYVCVCVLCVCVRGYCKATARQPHGNSTADARQMHGDGKATAWPRYRRRLRHGRTHERDARSVYRKNKRPLRG